ncbi:MAG: hypothetical protein M1274_09450 [Actinobacteria bacterium]|nr:hypothetical protein [Actinomycetota bacterium]
MTGRAPKTEWTTCGECSQPLRPVGTKTVKHVLHYPLARNLGPGLFFHCGNLDCDLVYVRDPGEGVAGARPEIFRRNDIKERARPFASGRERLVCYCFGYTVGEIEDDVHAGANVIPPTIAGEVQAGNCACEVMNPKGG